MVRPPGVRHSEQSQSCKCGQGVAGSRTKAIDEKWINKKCHAEELRMMSWAEKEGGDVTGSPGERISGKFSLPEADQDPLVIPAEGKGHRNDGSTTSVGAARRDP